MAKHIFFIHGLSGTPKKTWESFPDFLKERLGSEYTIDHLDYPSPPKWKIWVSAPTLLNIAESFILKLQDKCNLENDEIVLIGHSNGGVVIKKLLARLEFKKIVHNISKICFLDVPHHGSGYAIPGKILNPRNKHLKSLALNSPELVEINDIWLHEDYHRKFDILNLVAEVEDVVSAASSRFCYSNSLVIPDTNHGSIAKPINSDSIAVIKIVEFISNKSSLAKYRNSSSENFRDWLLHDGGRRHGHSYVADSLRLDALRSLQEALSAPGSIVRITGLSGLGKTRLIIEYIHQNQNLKEDNILVFKASSHENDVRENVKKAIRDGAYGLIVVEHCSIDLHDYLTREIVNYESGLRIITVNFYNDQARNSSHIHLEGLNDHSVSELVTPLLPQFNDDQIRRIVSFVEGFPLLAILIAERFANEGILSSELSERDFAEKLINGDGKTTEEQKRILQVCSLFDVFGVEAEGIKQADFIIDLAKSDRGIFGQVIKHFESRRIINRVGRYARIVPKPLAVHLASTWWENNIHDELEKLINSLPEGLIGSFCTQIKYLDSSKKVQEFVGRLCGPCSPFGQAELLLNKKGSRLFRALVEVNPIVTSNLLYRVFSSLTDEDIAAIEGDVRRNLVWALEMLVFHKSCFENASWCLFKLAQYENENFSNNALGQFCQLFRWQLSGTEADFNQRLSILNRALTLNVGSSDVVIIKAIESATNTYGGTRTIGAEFQGTKPELTEWHPKTYQEIYDYWQSLFDMLLEIINRGSLVELAKDAFGHQIRGLMRYKLPEVLDNFVREVIKLTGKYWPSAAQSITYALHYDSESMDQIQLELLRSWEILLSPDENSLEEQLKLIVLNPSKEHVQDKDGHYVDVAAVDAMNLAGKFKGKLTDLYQHFELLMTFPEQKQSWVFAKQLVLDLDNFEELLNATLEYLRNNNILTTQFFCGMLFGLHIRNPARWKETLELIGRDGALIKYYPDAIRTGKFETSHLETFVKLISEGKLASNTASILVYGRTTEHLTEAEISHFCMTLSRIDDTAVWVALDNMNMYSHGRSDIDLSLLTPTFKHLVLNVSFRKDVKHRRMGSYHWLTTVERLLQSEDAEFALQLCSRLIDEVGNHDVDYSDLWDYLSNAFYRAFELHGNYIWPKIADKFTDGTALKQYRLIDLLGSGKSYRERDKSIFDILEPGLVIDWCRDEEALLMVGRAVSMFIKIGEERILNPLLIHLIGEFSDSKSFLNEIGANFSSRSWSGSLVPYLEADKQVITTLTDHNNIKVRNWAVEFIKNIDHQIEYEMMRDAEENMLRS
ncbi:esterase/lipase family protein [Enterobacter hormaechei]|uniref:esterase/lipase family protein n=1 Tax=Enterobacter hormaechei TaxID=158836 RepID=UPI00287592EE|nr:hypothetical protein [Enterobacter hormaechei]MDR9983647.1 hypothetical protein [Enterobacter hormaechei subsp. steigerwaltii]